MLAIHEKRRKESSFKVYGAGSSCVENTSQNQNCKIISRELLIKACLRAKPSTLRNVLSKAMHSIKIHKIILIAMEYFIKLEYTI